jgi:hypothetical protein
MLLSNASPAELDSGRKYLGWQILDTEFSVGIEPASVNYGLKRIQPIRSHRSTVAVLNNDQMIAFEIVRIELKPAGGDLAA